MFYVCLKDRVKLTGGKTPNEGIANYYDGKKWGTVCDKRFWKWGWPSVMCKELGYDSASMSKLATKMYTGKGRGDIGFHKPACGPKKVKTK